MSIKKIISNYIRYNHWANEKMTGWLKTLDKDILYKETPSSFNSIDLTLQHMIHAQNFWFTILTEADFTSLDETIKLNAVETVMNDLLAGSQRMLDLCNEYTEEDFIKQVSTDVTTQNRHEFLLHYVNHNSYHRGQIITMGRSLGITGNIPLTDYEFFLYAE